MARLVDVGCIDCRGKSRTRTECCQVLHARRIVSVSAFQDGLAASEYVVFSVGFHDNACGVCSVPTSRLAKKLSVIEGHFSTQDYIASNHAPIIGGHRTKGIITSVGTMLAMFDEFSLDNLHQFISDYDEVGAFVMYLIKDKFQDVDWVDICPACLFTIGNTVNTKMADHLEMSDLGHFDNVRTRSRIQYKGEKPGLNEGVKLRSVGPKQVAAPGEVVADFVLPSGLERASDFTKYIPTLLTFDAGGLHLPLCIEPMRANSHVRNFLHCFVSYQQHLELLHNNVFVEDMQQNLERHVAVARYCATEWLGRCGPQLDELVVRSSPAVVLTFFKSKVPTILKKAIQSDLPGIVKEMHPEIVFTRAKASKLSARSFAIGQLNIEEKGAVMLQLLKSFRARQDLRKFFSGESFMAKSLSSALQASAQAPSVNTTTSKLLSSLQRVMNMGLVDFIRKQDTFSIDMFDEEGSLLSRYGEAKSGRSVDHPVSHVANMVLCIKATMRMKKVTAELFAHLPAHSVRIPSRRPVEIMEGFFSDVRNGCRPPYLRNGLESQPYHQADESQDKFTLRQAGRTMNSSYGFAALEKMFLVQYQSQSPLAPDFLVNLFVALFSPITTMYMLC